MRLLIGQLVRSTFCVTTPDSQNHHETITRVFCQLKHLVALEKRHVRLSTLQVELIAIQLAMSPALHFKWSLLSQPEWSAWFLVRSSDRFNHFHTKLVRSLRLLR